MKNNIILRNLTKKVKYLYYENYKRLMEEIEEDTNKYISCGLETRTIILSKMSILPKTICRFNAILIEIPMAFFTEVGRNIPKMYMNPQKTHK